MHYTIVLNAFWHKTKEIIKIVGSFFIVSVVPEKIHIPPMEDCFSLKLLTPCTKLHFSAILSLKK